MDIKNLTVIGICLSLLMGAGSLVLSLQKGHQEFGVVDTRQVISNQAEELARKDPQAHLSSVKVQSLATRIESLIDHWGRKHKIILLSKPAVLSGDLPDYTRSILEALNSSQEFVE